jgi:putative SOS response-associated peptidase YedK
MCGRYTLSKTDEIFARFQVPPDSLELAPRYNIAPDAILPVVVRTEGNELKLMRWGLTPSWSKDGKSLAINARMEGILAKPSFRKPVRDHRCLIPATGFYEWQAGAGGKTPYYIRRKDEALFAFAGIYDRWKDPQNGDIHTFAIMTAAAGSPLSEIHNRMPVILDPRQESLWLSTEPDRTESLLESLEPLPSDQLEFYAVSPRVNSARTDSPELIQRV